MIGKKCFERNGVEYVSYITAKSFDGLACLGAKKLVLNGQVDLVLMKGSYKFGEQIQLKVYAHKDANFVETTRNNSDYNRIEIDIPAETFLTLIKLALGEAQGFFSLVSPLSLSPELSTTGGVLCDNCKGLAN